MEAITITRPVLIKVRVTENYRKARAAALQGAVQRIDNQLQQLELQGKRIISQLEKQNPQAVLQTRQKIEEEKHGLLGTRQKLVEGLKEAGRWSVGEEVLDGRVESLVEIKVGDQWSAVMGVEVVLEDGLVVEIRSGGEVVVNND